MANPIRGRADYLFLGDWKAVCSLCGRKRKASELVQNWQGFWRCPEHNEARNAQDFVRGIPDIQTPPWVQPQKDINIQVCSFNGCSGIPGWAMPGCSVPGRKAIQPFWGMAAFNFVSAVDGQTSGVTTE